MRALAAVVVLSLAIASCGGSGDEGSSGETPDTSTPTTQGGSGEGGSDGGVTSVPGGNGGPECLPDTICETDLRLEEIHVTDDEMEEIAIDGETAYITTESGALLVVDLAAGSVTSTFTFETEALDVAIGGSEVWMLSEDGPAEVDTNTGALSNQGSLTGFNDAGHIVIGESGVWVVSNGTGDVSRFDRSGGEPTATITDYDKLSASGRPRIAATDDFVFAIDEYAGRVLQIDPADNSIAEVYEDLGFESEAQGSSTAIIASGPASLTVTGGTVWVISNLANPEGEFISGVGAVYTLDPSSGTSEKAFDLVGDPQPEAGFAVTDTAIWYIETTSGELIRVDRDSGQQHRLRTDGFYTARNVIVADGTIWVTAGGSLLRIDDAAAGVLGN